MSKIGKTTDSRMMHTPLLGPLHMESLETRRQEAKTDGIDRRLTGNFGLHKPLKRVEA